jgi:hypothetical protein
MSRRPSLGRQPAPVARDSSPSQRNLAWFALFVVASVVGGLAAAAIEHVSALEAAGLSLIVAAVAAFALYAGLLDDDRAGPARLAGPPADRPMSVSPSAGFSPTMPMHPSLTPPTSPTPTPAGSPRPAPSADSVQPGVVQLLHAEPSGGAWWRAARPATGPGGSAGQDTGAAGPRPANLADFLDHAVIAQCPRCGSFRVGADSQAADWRFGCQECGQRWSWRPGSPWPPVQVRPAERRRTGPPPA